MVAAKTTKTTKKAPVKALPAKELLSVPEELTYKDICGVLTEILGVVVPDKDAFYLLSSAGEKFKLEPYELGRGAAYTKEYLTRIVEKYNGQNA